MDEYASDGMPGNEDEKSAKIEYERNSFKRFLNKLRESNRRSFGTGQPDCCSLNRDLGRAQTGRKHLGGKA